jgi:Xaa-Pro aminopeptidase
MRTEHSERIKRLRRMVEEADADGLLTTHLPNVFYLSGFTGSAAALLVEPTRITIFTDGRYAIQAREEARPARVRITRGSLLAAVGEHLRMGRKARIAFDPAHLSVAGKQALQKGTGRRIRWLPRGNLVEGLRAVKSAKEIARMRDAARLGSAVFEEVLPLVKPGVRELDLAAEIEYRMRRMGASGPSFDTIVASGARAALPHARPTAKRLRKNELVVLDLGAILRHYCCDLTRTVHLGRAPSKIRRWYQAVEQAREAALETLHAGVAAGEVDAAARRVLQQAGLGRYFVHSTGHGLGLEVHEEPRLAMGQRKLIEAGNVVTLEPGVYVEDQGGIRLEDDVAVLANRTEVLTCAPRGLLEL